MKIRRSKLLETVARADRDEVERKGLWAFVQLAWPQLESRSLDVGWHLELLCQRLEDVFYGRTTRLAIAMPPGTTKSSIGCVLFPAWCWTRDAGYRTLYASSDVNLAFRDANKTRDLVQSPWFRRRWPRVILTASVPKVDRSGKSDKVSEYYTTAGGMRYTTTVRAQKLGYHANLAFTDDPHRRDEEDRPLALDQVFDWWTKTVSTRAVDRATFAMIAMHQMIAAGDLVNRLIDELDYEHLVLPLEYDPNHPRMHQLDPRTEPGEVLCPVRYPPESLPEVKRTLGRRATAAQLQQNPEAPGGTLWEETSFRSFAAVPAGCTWVVVDSWDGTFGKVEGGELRNLDEKSRVVGQRWAFSGLNCFMLAESRGRWTTREAEKHAADLARTPTLPETSLDTILIEDAAHGTVLADDVRDRIQAVARGIAVVMVGTGGKSKTARARAIVPDVEDGRVYLPARVVSKEVRGGKLVRALLPGDVIGDGWQEDLKWRREWLDEVTRFPRKPDDRADAMDQALTSDVRPRRVGI